MNYIEIREALIRLRNELPLNDIKNPKSKEYHYLALLKGDLDTAIHNLKNLIEK